MPNDVRSPNANLPRSSTKLKLYESDGKIFLDISDATGGLGLLIDLDLVVASQLGQRMADMARNTVAKVSDAPDRRETHTFTNKVDYNAFVQPAQLPPDPSQPRRPRKSRSLQSKLKTQLALPRASAD